MGNLYTDIQDEIEGLGTIAKFIDGERDKAKQEFLLAGFQAIYQIARAMRAIDPLPHLDCYENMGERAAHMSRDLQAVINSAWMARDSAEDADGWIQSEFDHDYDRESSRDY